MIPGAAHPSYHVLLRCVGVNQFDFICKSQRGSIPCVFLLAISHSHCKGAKGATVSQKPVPIVGGQRASKSSMERNTKETTNQDKHIRLHFVI